MSVKVFQTNKSGKIEFTRCELEKLLNETYNEGYRDGENHAKSSYWTWTSPSIVNTTPYYGVTCLDADKAIRANDVGNVTLTGTIGDTITGTVTSKTNASTISTADCSINADEAKKISVQTPSNDKTFKVDITASVDSPDAKGTQRTYQFDGMTFNLNDLANTVDAMLSGKYDFASMFVNPIDNTNVNGAKKAVEDTPFTNLAKELVTL
jgi:hypothetical protein